MLAPVTERMDEHDRLLATALTAKLHGVLTAAVAQTIQHPGVRSRHLTLLRSTPSTLLADELSLAASRVARTRRASASRALNSCAVLASAFAVERLNTE